MAIGDITLSRGASVTITITLASLATSSSRVAGRESNAVTSTAPAIDYLVGGKITTGTSPTSGKQIDVWVYGELDDAPTYPDVFDGTDSVETVTSENVRNSAIKLAASVLVDSTSDLTYPIAPFSVAALFGGALPGHWGLFVAHDTAVNFNATSGNHFFKATPIYANVAAS